MGEVWRARDTRLGREVALKVLPQTVARDREVIGRFQREAQLLAAFNHTNIAAIYSFENVDGVQLLVMEMVPGDTVKELLVAGPLPLPRALAIARQIAEALDAAHAKGILHRDLKPANVKVTPDGQVKLLDFGLAKAFAPGTSGSDISESPTLEADATRQGVVLGTVPYMSPEQARGRVLDRRSDVWSFGCLLYEMLARRKTFSGESQTDILVAILERKPDWTALPKETPPRIRTLLEECLTKDLDKRAPDMAHVRHQLEVAGEGKSHVSSRSFAPRAPRVWASAGAFLAVAAAVLVYVSLRGRSTNALPASKLLAILPATDLTGRPDGRQLCDGVSVSLGVRLQSVPGVAIMHSSGPAMLQETDLAKWARDTGANLLVQPAVRQVGDTRQLSYTVLLAGSPVQLAAGEVTGPATEHFRLEDELTQKLIATLRVQLASGAPASAPASSTFAPGPAQTDYVVATGYLERYDDKDSVEKAISLLTKLPDAEKSALVEAALGRAYLASYDLSKDVTLAELARTAAERAVALDATLPEAQVTLGRILSATGETEAGIRVFQKGLQQRPNDADTLRVLALSFMKAGRLDEAEKAFQRVVKLRPRAWSAYSGLGYFYFGTHRYSQAADAYRKGIELNPGVARLHYNLGAAYIRTEDYPKAEAALRRSTEIAPTAPAFSNLGTLYYMQGRYPESARALGRAAELDPLDFWTHKAFADVLLRISGEADRASHEYGEAVRLATEALRVNPRSGEAQAVIGVALARTSRTKSGLAAIQKALALEPDNVLVLQSSAIVFARAGMTSSALDALDRALGHGLGPHEVETEPEFTSLRAEPRYSQILEKHRKGRETS
jgi:serine/threonine-protein kinase